MLWNILFWKFGTSFRYTPYPFSVSGPFLLVPTRGERSDRDDSSSSPSLPFVVFIVRQRKHIMNRRLMGRYTENDQWEANHLFRSSSHRHNGCRERNDDHDDNQNDIGVPSLASFMTFLVVDTAVADNRKSGGEYAANKFPINFGLSFIFRTFFLCNHVQRSTYFGHGVG